MPATRKTSLDSGWYWKQRDLLKSAVIDEIYSAAEGGQYEWTPTASFPSEIHVELMKANVIPDPYVEFNEHKVQCKYISGFQFHLVDKKL
jgi:beta-mannosidase